MAAQIACVASLLGAGAGTSLARGSAPSPSDDREASALERTEETLRLRGQGGGCFQPVTWGPPVPASVSEGSLAEWTRAIAEAA